MSEIIESSTQMINETLAAQGGYELPQGKSMDEPTMSAAQSEEPAEGGGETSDSIVEVDGQKFANEKAAFDYLQGQYGQLKTERMIEEARLQGIQEALYNMPRGGEAPITAPMPQPEVDLDKFYENPTEFLKNYADRIKDSLKGELSAQHTAAQRDAEVWNTFTAKHPDLADFRQDVDSVAMAHKDTVALLARRDPAKAMDFVATKVREKFHKYIEATMPNRVLPNAKMGPSSSGNHSATNQQRVPVPDKAVDFVTQLRNMKKA